MVVTIEVHVQQGLCNSDNIRMQAGLVTIQKQSRRAGQLVPYFMGVFIAVQIETLQPFLNGLLLTFSSAGDRLQRIDDLPGLCIIGVVSFKCSR